jgi:hypothetical protein
MFQANHGAKGTSTWVLAASNARACRFSTKLCALANAQRLVAIQSCHALALGRLPSCQVA